MANGTDISGLVADPQFQSLPPADKRAALQGVTGDKTFGTLSDAQTMEFVGRFPRGASTQPPSIFTPGDFQTMPGSPIYNPNRLGSQPLPYASTAAAISGAKARAQLPNFPQQVQQAGSAAAGMAPEVGGTIGLVGGPLGMGLGTGLGTIAQARMQGKPSSASEVAMNAGLAYATGKVADVTGNLIGKGYQKLMGASPEYVAKLQTLFPKEQALEQAVNMAEEDSRAAFHAAYPKIDAAPLDMADTKKVAVQGIKEMRAVGTVPQAAGKVANVPTLTMEDALNSDNLAEFYQKLDQVDKIPFRQGQQLRTAVEKYIARNHPTGPIYDQLKAISGSLTNGLETTAAREGVLDQFRAGEQLFKQHAADFWNKGAPLKDYLPIQKGGKVVAGQEGATINRFLDVANQSRALDALQRRGVPVTDIKAILAQGPKAVTEDIGNAVTLRNMGQDVLNQQVRAPARQTARNWALGTLGAGSVGGLIDWLAQKH